MELTKHIKKLNSSIPELEKNNDLSLLKSMKTCISDFNKETKDSNADLVQFILGGAAPVETKLNEAELLVLLKFLCVLKKTVFIESQRVPKIIMDIIGEILHMGALSNAVLYSLNYLYCALSIREIPNDIRSSLFAVITNQFVHQPECGQLCVHTCDSYLLRVNEEKREHEIFKIESRTYRVDNVGDDVIVSWRFWHHLFNTTISDDDYRLVKRVIQYGFDSPHEPDSETVEREEPNVIPLTGNTDSISQWKRPRPGKRPHGSYTPKESVVHYFRKCLK